MSRNIKFSLEEILSVIKAIITELNYFGIVDDNFLNDLKVKLWANRSNKKEFRLNYFKKAHMLINILTNNLVCFKGGLKYSKEFVDHLFLVVSDLGLNYLSHETCEVMRIMKANDMNFMDYSL